tara:strand:+ start:563 stop:1195 length:633 start_codon:yes stop_codon:yes gene_type:complete
MSDSSNDFLDQHPESSEKSSLPDGVPKPPLPAPNLKDLTETGPTYVTDSPGQKKTRSHPTDAYPPLKKRRACVGACGCLAVAATLIFLMVALIVIVSCFGPGRPLFDDYEIVNLDETNKTITEAPIEPTYYIGQNISYLAPVTKVPIAIFGTDVVLAGDFHETITVTASKITGRPTARFAKDLVLYTKQFTNDGILLKGERKGIVIKLTP